MRVLAIAAAVALMVGGCAHMPSQPQVNRAAKSDKYASPAKRDSVSTPAAKPAGTTFKQRWMPKFRVQWLHPK